MKVASPSLSPSLPGHVPRALRPCQRKDGEESDNQEEEEEEDEETERAEHKRTQMTLTINNIGENQIQSQRGSNRNDAGQWTSHRNLPVRR